MAVTRSVIFNCNQVHLTDKSSIYHGQLPRKGAGLTGNRPAFLGLSRNSTQRRSFGIRIALCRLSMRLDHTLPSVVQQTISKGTAMTTGRNKLERQSKLYRDVTAVTRIISASFMLGIVTLAISGCNTANSTTVSTYGGDNTTNDKPPVTLLNVSYDPTRELYRRIQQRVRQVIGRKNTGKK